MQSKLTAGRNLIVLLGISLFLVALVGCAKTDYSDTNEPEKPKVAGATGGDVTKPGGGPHGQGRHVGAMPIPAVGPSAQPGRYVGGPNGTAPAAPH